MSVEIENLKQELSALAERIALQGFGIKLDYSVESIREADKVLGGLHEEFKTTKNDEGFTGIALEFAAYIVRVAEKATENVRWERDHPKIGKDSFPLYLGKDDAVFPLGWCSKRLYDGPGDDIWTKFNLLILKRDPPIEERKGFFRKLFSG